MILLLSLRKIHSKEAASGATENSIVGKACALHTSDLDSISGTPYGNLGPVRSDPLGQSQE